MNTSLSFTPNSAFAAEAVLTEADGVNRLRKKVVTRKRIQLPSFMKRTGAFLVVKRSLELDGTKRRYGFRPITIYR